MAIGVPGGYHSGGEYTSQYSPSAITPNLMLQNAQYQQTAGTKMLETAYGLEAEMPHIPYHGVDKETNRQFQENLQQAKMDIASSILDDGDIQAAQRKLFQTRRDIAKFKTSEPYIEAVRRNAEMAYQVGQIGKSTWGRKEEWFKRYQENLQKGADTALGVVPDKDIDWTAKVKSMSAMLQSEKGLAVGPDGNIKMKSITNPDGTVSYLKEVGRGWDKIDKQEAEELFEAGLNMDQEVLTHRIALEYLDPTGAEEAKFVNGLKNYNLTAAEAVAKTDVLPGTIKDFTPEENNSNNPNNPLDADFPYINAIWSETVGSYYSPNLAANSQYANIHKGIGIDTHLQASRETTKNILADAYGFDRGTDLGDNSVDDLYNQLFIKDLKTGHISYRSVPEEEFNIAAYLEKHNMEDTADNRAQAVKEIKTALNLHAATITDLENKEHDIRQQVVLNLTQSYGSSDKVQKDLQEYLVLEETLNQKTNTLRKPLIEAIQNAPLDNSSIADFNKQLIEIASQSLNEDDLKLFAQSLHSPYAEERIDGDKQPVVVERSFKDIYGQSSPEDVANDLSKRFKDLVKYDSVENKHKPIIEEIDKLRDEASEVTLAKYAFHNLSNLKNSDLYGSTLWKEFVEKNPDAAFKMRRAANIAEDYRKGIEATDAQGIRTYLDKADKIYLPNGEILSYGEDGNLRAGNKTIPIDDVTAEDIEWKYKGTTYVNGYGVVSLVTFGDQTLLLSDQESEQIYDQGMLLGEVDLHDELQKAFENSNVVSDFPLGRAVSGEMKGDQMYMTATMAPQDGSITYSIYHLDKKGNKQSVADPRIKKQAMEFKGTLREMSLKLSESIKARESELSNIPYNEFTEWYGSNRPDSQGPVNLYSPEVLNIREEVPLPEYSDIDSERIWDNMLQQESKTTHVKEDGTLVESSAGALGIAQLMPDTAESLVASGETYNPYDTEQNIEYSRRYLNQTHNQFKNKVSEDSEQVGKKRMQLALMAYNWGPGALEHYLNGTSDEYASVPAETVDYIEKILGAGSYVDPKTFVK